MFRPRFLTKSRLAFTIFNSLLLGLLLIHFVASLFYEPTNEYGFSDQPPNMVFPALFATGLLDDYFLEGIFIFRTSTNGIYGY